MFILSHFAHRPKRPSHNRACRTPARISFFNSHSAACLAACAMSLSSGSFATRIAGMPLCLTPSHSPGPRKDKSILAMVKPSSFSRNAFNRATACADKLREYKRIQVPGLSPRPTGRVTDAVAISPCARGLPPPSHRLAAHPRPLPPPLWRLKDQCRRP